MLINRVPIIRGTSPLIITSSLKLSSTSNKAAFIASDDNPKVSQAMGIRISFKIGFIIRFKAVKIREIIAKGYISWGAEKPGI
ncbi:MAG: hypothetical protein PHH27_01000 [Candidatus Colwellbacteria bacterium]|nr:hypothetical protein [Candidatus Colwellbacteria bacterium]